MRGMIDSHHGLLRMVAAIFMTCVLILGMSTPYSWADAVASGTETVTYVNANGSTQKVTANVVNEGDYYDVTWDSGWYVIKGSVNVINSSVINGDVKIILADGCKLSCQADPDSYNPGMKCEGDNSLTIYGQSGQTGKAEFFGGKYAPGIGNYYKNNASGNGTITINGGIITAQGGDSAAGIGGGRHCDGSNITINRGTVTAEGGLWSAGIGAGSKGSCRNVTITGGTVNATGGYEDNVGTGGAGIGSATGGTCENISITGGTVNAHARCDHVAAIGAGYNGTSKNIYVSEDYMIKAGEESATDVIEHESTTDLSTVSAFGQKYVYIAYDTTRTHYITADGSGKSVYAETFTGGNGSCTLQPGWYVVKGDVTVNGSIYLADGYVNLILTDDSTLTINASTNQPGISCTGDQHLTIYGQTKQTGKLVANAGGGAAGIGGYNSKRKYSGRNLTINGGNIWAYGGIYGAGIGGAETGGACCDIVINRGSVHAYGGYEAAGIGGGYDKYKVAWSGGILNIGGPTTNLTINGGTVYACGGTDGAGIGGGYDGGYAQNINIKGGNVTARGGGKAAGIGGGRCGIATGIHITGGTVYARGGDSAWGIGNGNKPEEGTSDDITVSSNLTVKAGSSSADTVISHNDNTDLCDISQFRNRYVSIEGDGTYNDSSDAGDIQIANIKYLKVGKKKLTVKASCAPATKGGNYYRIAYRAKGTSTWKYTKAMTSKKIIKNLKSGKRYYVKMRVCKKPDDTTYYGGWSETKLSKKIK